MSSSRILARASRLSARHANVTAARPFSSATTLLADEPRSVPLSERVQDTAHAYRKFMLDKPLNPHLTNTTSTIGNDFPSLGADKPPADMLTSVDPSFTPKDSKPANTEKMTGGTQAGGPAGGANAELGVGEIAGGQFKVEPHRREGESEETMRARLLYQSRKRGTLEADLLLSTFADARLARLSPAQMRIYDRFLDENDWDIYYWATQQPSPTSAETAEGGAPHLATAAAQRGSAAPPAATEATGSGVRPRPDGEWSNTVGTFKPAYRPVPARWQGSEMLAMLREHVRERSADGAPPPVVAAAPAEKPTRGRKKKAAPAASAGGEQQSGGRGMGFMPELREGLRRGEAKD